MSLSPIPTKPTHKTTVVHSTVGLSKTERIALSVVGATNAALQKLLHLSHTRA